MAEKMWRRYARFWGADDRADIDEELRLHMELRFDEARARGLSEEDARAETEQAFGDADVVRNRLLLMSDKRRNRKRKARYVSDILQDAKLTLRGFARSRGYTTTVVTILAIAIAATTAILSLVNGVLLRPLPYPQGDRLVVAWERNIPKARGANVVEVPAWEDWSERAKSFSALSALVPDHGTILTDRAERVQGASVSASWFAVTRTQPAMGRAFTAAEAAADAPVIVLSNALWRTSFGGDPKIIGKAVKFTDRTRTVVGVMGREFVPPAFGWLDSNQQYWVPFAATASNRTWGRFLLVLGRMQPNVTIDGAARELASLYANSTGAEQHKDWTVEAVGLREQMAGDVRVALIVLFCAASLLFVTALVNIGNLVLLKFQRQRVEFAVRSALGAGKARLLRQLVAEAITIVIAATIPGIIAAQLLLRAIVAVMPKDMPRLEGVHIDYRVLEGTVALLVLATVVLAALPGMRVTRSRLETWLRSSSTRVTAAGTGRVIVIAEVAMAVMLCVGAGLALRTYINLQSARMGFAPDGLTTFRITLEGGRYQDAGARAQFLASLRERILRESGSSEVAYTSIRPLAGGGTTTDVTATGAHAPANDQPAFDVRIVSPEYFRTLRIPVTGSTSTFDDARVSDPRVAIVSRSAATVLFGDENVIGRSIDVVMSGGITARVVAIAGDVRAHAPAEDARPTVYFPMSQDVQSRVDVLVSSDNTPAQTAAAVRSALHDIDPEIAIEDPTTMHSIVAEATAQQRTTLLLLGAFAVIAAALAAAGIYAVLATHVTDRRKDFGIRMSLGASPARLQREVLTQGLLNTAIGTSIGIAGAIATTGFMASLWYGVTGLDLNTYATTVLAIALVATAASLLPARAAGKTPPAEALRS